MTETLKRINRAATLAFVVGTLLSLLAAAQVLAWGLDRSPPVRLLAYSAAPVAAGGTASVYAVVQRAQGRKCTSTQSHHLVDSTGRRFDLTTAGFSETLQSGAVGLTQGRTFTAFAVPEHASQGVSRVVEQSKYICNPIHQLYPIPVTLEFAVVITAPESELK